jgi:uncharacterized membrane protein
MQPLIAYLGTAIVFFAIDFVWLAFIAKTFYAQQLGPLMRESPNLTVAAVFYVVYVVGVVVFAVMPAVRAESWATALALGALLGLVAYGTYDATNLATLKNWPTIVSVVDVIWGTALTAVSATAGYFFVRLLTSGG